MRPIERGARPLNPDRTPKTYTSYGNSRRDLIDRMGQYCAYCNQKLPASLAVEHVQPKALEPHLELEWENFVLACTNCNSTKGKKPVKLAEYLWPDVHNTHLAFIYTADGKVKVNPNLPGNIKLKAQNLLDLVGLQKYPDNPTSSDRRWVNRRDTFVKANAAMLLYNQAIENGAGDEFEKLLGYWSADNGFFSIWMQIFDKNTAIKKEIIKAFTGTANCFDADFNPILRNQEL
ncbi:HNH endonuclease [Lunatimonas salinarum]|uniref:HNH endonuclease n=1 Tax=Lunatimonas salinarum TaxID=1774590 RepID=UPI001ADFE33F|nr:HNH endonuclease [Lunatimonas salinarum]